MNRVESMNFLYINMSTVMSTVARPGGVTVINQRRDIYNVEFIFISSPGLINTHNQKYVWHYYCGLVPHSWSTWVVTPGLRNTLPRFGAEKVIWFSCFWPNGFKSKEDILYSCVNTIHRYIYILHLYIYICIYKNIIHIKYTLKHWRHSRHRIPQI